jgi:hypothetical protein
MKKTISKLQMRSYCWLPLIAVCVVLPVRADQMSFTASSSGQNGHLTLTGFDPSLGTLTGVTVSVDFDTFTNSTSNDREATGTVNVVASFTGQLDLPDSTTLDLAASASLDAFIGASETVSVDPDDHFI